MYKLESLRRQRAELQQERRRIDEKRRVRDEAEAQFATVQAKSMMRVQRAMKRRAESAKERHERILNVVGAAERRYAATISSASQRSLARAKVSSKPTAAAARRPVASPRPSAPLATFRRTTATSSAGCCPCGSPSRSGGGWRRCAGWSRARRTSSAGGPKPGRPTSASATSSRPSRGGSVACRRAGREAPHAHRPASATSATSSWWPPRRNAPSACSASSTTRSSSATVRGRSLGADAPSLTSTPLPCPPVAALDQELHAAVLQSAAEVQHRQDVAESEGVRQAHGLGDADLQALQQAQGTRVLASPPRPCLTACLFRRDQRPTASSSTRGTTSRASAILFKASPLRCRSGRQARTNRCRTRSSTSATSPRRLRVHPPRSKRRPHPQAALRARRCAVAVGEGL